MEINILDLSLNINHNDYDKVYADCFILTSDKRLLLQKRPETWPSFPNALTPFGGCVENETVENAIIRELKEELDVKVKKSDIHFLMVMEEIFDDDKFLIYLHWWHDKNDTVQDCFEGERAYFDTIQQAVEHPVIMPHALIGLEHLSRTLRLCG